MYNFPTGMSHKDPAFRRIEKIIEGFRGYETVDDLKAADGQVRSELARQMKKTRNEADEARKILEKKLLLSVLLDFSEMITLLEKALIKLARPPNQIINECRKYTPEEDTIGKIYSLDFQILSDAENAYNLMQEFQRMEQEDLIRSNILKITMATRDILARLDEKDRLINCMLKT
jgi:hypothetical protein